MRLQELEKFSAITIQMHDNPDADAIGSGYVLYRYFSEKGISVRLVYSGRYQIQKSNLKLFMEYLHIPVEYVENIEDKIPGLLLTVDSQYGAGNITRLHADAIAIIDHHQTESEDMDYTYCEIRPDMGSCATVVWDMLRAEGCRMEQDITIGTALYYALYMDTNQFAELENPLDRDMLEEVSYDKGFIMRLKNSNISLKELEIAGIALIRSIFNEDYHYAIIQSQPCDPNLLGLISDFVLQVDQIHTCVVYNATEEGFKFSVRSCTKEVKANELAQFLAQGMGSGGGHFEKAGGFISKRRYEKNYPGVHSENYFGRRLNAYYESYDVIDLRNFELDTSDMQRYESMRVPFGYLELAKYLKADSMVTIRTLEGDKTVRVMEDSYLLIGLRGEVYQMPGTKFRKNYELTQEQYQLKEGCYIPRFKNLTTGVSKDLLQFSKCCYLNAHQIVYGKKLDKTVKLFLNREDGSYMLGRVGDYLVADRENAGDIYMIEQEIFEKIYRREREDTHEFGKQSL